MSTAGKVLTVLILLVMVGWIVMLSAVTQLNVNWQAKIISQQKAIQASDDKLAQATTSYRTATEATLVEQAAEDRDLRDIRTRIAYLEARLSIKTEDLSRSQIQVTDYEAAVAQAGTHKTHRLAEHTKAEADLAAKRTEIAQRQEENGQLRDQLARLQDDFKRLLTNNMRQLNRNADRPAAQPTSDRRPSPSS